MSCWHTALQRAKRWLCDIFSVIPSWFLEWMVIMVLNKLRSDMESMNCWPYQGLVSMRAVISPLLHHIGQYLWCAWSAPGIIWINNNNYTPENHTACLFVSCQAKHKVAVYCKLLTASVRSGRFKKYSYSMHVTVLHILAWEYNIGTIY